MSLLWRVYCRGWLNNGWITSICYPSLFRRWYFSCQNASAHHVFCALILQMILASIFFTLAEQQIDVPLHFPAWTQDVNRLTFPISLFSLYWFNWMQSCMREKKRSIYKDEQAFLSTWEQSLNQDHHWCNVSPLCACFWQPVLSVYCLQIH